MKNILILAFLCGSIATNVKAASSQFLPITPYTVDMLTNANQTQLRAYIGIISTSAVWNANSSQLEAPGDLLQIKSGASITNPTLKDLTIVGTIHGGTIASDASIFDFAFSQLTIDTIVGSGFNLDNLGNYNYVGTLYGNIHGATNLLVDTNQFTSNPNGLAIKNGVIMTNGYFTGSFTLNNAALFTNDNGTLKIIGADASAASFDGGFNILNAGFTAPVIRLYNTGAAQFDGTVTVNNLTAPSITLNGDTRTSWPTNGTGSDPNALTNNNVGAVTLKSNLTVEGNVVISSAASTNVIDVLDSNSNRLFYVRTNGEIGSVPINLDHWNPATNSPVDGYVLSATGNRLKWIEMVAGTNCTAANITANPTNISVLTNSDVLFSVTAAGTAPLSYRWENSIVTLTNGNYYAGVDTANLWISNVVIGQNGWQFQCEVSNACGVVTSTVATMTVTNGTGGGSPNYILQENMEGANAFAASGNGTLDLTEWTASAGSVNADKSTSGLNMESNHCATGGAGEYMYHSLTATNELWFYGLYRATSDPTSRRTILYLSHIGGAGDTAIVSIRDSDTLTPTLCVDLSGGSVSKTVSTLSSNTTYSIWAHVVVNGASSTISAAFSNGTTEPTSGDNFVSRTVTFTDTTIDRIYVIMNGVDTDYWDKIRVSTTSIGNDPQ